MDWCADLGIGVVTLWVLSTDNLTRSGPEEIGPLLQVIARLVSDLARTDSYRVQVAVSYTHLDVYKRQGVMPRWSQPRSTGLGADSTLNGGPS